MSPTLNFTSLVAKDIYHTSRLKSDFSNLRRYIDEGASSKFADGYGQGHGFYVWTTLKKAIIHSEFLRGIQRKEDNYVVLKFCEVIDAKNWDLDYECNSFFVSAFVSGHWGIFKKIPDHFLYFNQDGKKCFIIPSESEKIRFFGSSGLYLRIFYQEEGSDKMHRFEFGIGKRMRDGELNQGYVEKAPIVATIFNYFQKVYPEKTARFELNFFKKIWKRGVAIKYVGEERLKLKSFNLIINKKLLSCRKSKKYLLEHGFKI